MKIISIRSYSKKLALKKPYTIAYNTYSDVELVFSEIELENGITGIGSASPSEDVVGESPAQTLVNLQTEFIQKLVGRDIRHFRQLIYETKKHFHHLPGTQAAIDLALHDAFGKYLGIPVVDFYGRKIKSLPTSVTIGIKPVAETLQDAAEYAQMGFRVLKVKTGLNVQEDIERIAKLHERYQNKFTIRVDANQGYTIEALQQFIAGTGSYGIELIEQPVPVGSETTLLALDAPTRKIIAGDESIKDPAAALEFSAAPQPFGIYNIKLMKCGGILGAQEIAGIAEHAGIELFWGCNDESILSIAAALHIAYACTNTRYLDLDGSLDLAEDLVTGGFRLEEGHMIIGTQPGLGIHKI
ncbi:MAG: dipeptide epimerase [Sediminibacterium sp.]|nr:dipeptide epimerase [Sediminibacterium sp.]